jgi:hypothetical protein
VAALIQEQTGVVPDVIEGRRGEFTVWVGDELLAQKGAEGFPADSDVLAGVQKHLALETQRARKPEI